MFKYVGVQLRLACVILPECSASNKGYCASVAFCYVALTHSWSNALIKAAVSGYVQGSPPALLHGVVNKSASKRLFVNSCKNYCTLHFCFTVLFVSHYTLHLFVAATVDLLGRCMYCVARLQHVSLSCLLGECSNCSA